MRDGCGKERILNYSAPSRVAREGKFNPVRRKQLEHDGRHDCSELASARATAGCGIGQQTGSNEVDNGKGMVLV